MSHLMNTYNRRPVTFTHGEGAWLWDINGKRYLDALSGIAVNTLLLVLKSLIRSTLSEHAEILKANY